MAEKVSWTELRRILATRAGVSEKEANAFLNALNAQVVEALKIDKQVKINGLGIFKLQPVAPRKSVNVATGEAITIEGYNKVVFMPEAGVKELIERGGGAEGKGEELAAVDPIKKLGSQAEEIVDILGELGQSPKEEKAEEPEPVVVPEPEPVKEPEPIKEPEVPEVAEEPVKAPEPEPEPEPEPVKEPEPEPKPVKEPAPEPEQPKKKEKKYHFVRDTLICVVILLLLLLVGYFFLRSQLGGWIDSLLQENPQTEQVVAADTTAAVAVAPIEGAEGEVLTEEQVLAEFLECSEETEEQVTPEETIYEDLLAIENMHEASRLTWMAKRFYGSKAYWPYIYDANKDHISNPSNIEVGTPIRVPRLTEAQKDTTSAAYKQLLREAEAACRK